MLSKNRIFATMVKMSTGISDNNEKIPLLAVIAVLLGVLIYIFGDLLFSPGETVLSRYGTDLSHNHLFHREFVSRQLRQGNLPLWNPHIFSGTPYTVHFATLLFYPLYLLFPLPNAINLSIAVHIFLGGLFMYLWASHRGLRPLASLFSSVTFMFCGAHFMHIYAGHLVILSGIAWTPLLFLAIDRWSKRPNCGSFLLGSLSIAMQILVGHPQYLFFTTIAVVLYSVFSGIKIKRRIIHALGIIGMYAQAALLSAVQLFPNIQATAQSTRSSNLPYEIASSFSLPPENLLTFIAPWFFGGRADLPYWGRWYLWEMNIFIGITALVLAVYASVCAERRTRHFSLTMVFIFLILAIGAYTPLYRLLYVWAPGFSKFRGSSKFVFQASLFIIMLAGVGLDHLIGNRRIPRKIILITLLAGLLSAAAAFFIRHSVLVDPAGPWQNVMSMIPDTEQTYLATEAYKNPAFVRAAGLSASYSMITAACVFLLLSLLLFLVRFSHRATYAIVALATAEMLFFAGAARSSFALSSTPLTEMRRFSAKNPGDYRILYLQNPSTAMSSSMYNIWGYDPIVSARYAQFINLTQGQDPQRALQYLNFLQPHKLLKMLRLRYVFVHNEGRIDVIEDKDVLPQLLLIEKFRVITESDQIFGAMADSSFDPRQTVILESDPEVMPVSFKNRSSENKGTAKILNSSTDHLTIEVETPHSAILLITDSFNKGWRARALPGSVQKRYNIMPANYILRAIPLVQGYHLIRVEYLPLSFQVGKWVSIFSAIQYIGTLGWYLRKKRTVN